MKGLAANYCLQGGLLLRKAVEQDVPGFKGAVEKQAFVTDKGSQIRGSVNLRQSRVCQRGRLREIQQGKVPFRTVSTSKVILSPTWKLQCMYHACSGLWTYPPSRHRPEDAESVHNLVDLPL